MVDSEPVGTGFESLCRPYIFLVHHTYAVTQTVQIRGIIMTATDAAYIFSLLRMTDSRRIKKVPKNKKIKNMSKLSTCKRSINHL